MMSEARPSFSHMYCLLVATRSRSFQVRLSGDA